MNRYLIINLRRVDVLDSKLIGLKTLITQNE